MTWLLRLVAWASLFAIPAWLVSSAYQRVLAAVAGWPFTWFGLRIEMVDFNVAAPLDLGLFVAMCLASRRAAPRRRRNALVFGIPAMMLLEVLTVVAAMAIVLLSQSRESFAATMRMLSYVIETIPWVSAAMVWLVLLGPYEIPRAVQRSMPGTSR